MSKAQLHEILAVEGDHEGRTKKLIAETLSTFKNKENLFKGSQRSLVMFGKDEANSLELQAVEQKESKVLPLASTIPENLNYLAAIIGDYYDVVYQKEATNQVSKADLKIQGRILVPDVPVTFLLSLESRLKEVRAVIVEIPTLEPEINWTADASHAKKNVWRSTEKHDLKSVKDTDFRITVQPTQFHPAQVVTFDTVRNIGQYTDLAWSGKISSADKAQLLTNIDTLISEVKKARQRANSTPLVDNPRIGDVLMKHIFGNFFDRATTNTDEKVSV